MEKKSSYNRQSAIEGALLGTAVGDAIGLPYEGLSRRRAKRLLGSPDRHRFLFGRGMVSDDTEHSCMVIQALISSGDDEEAFARHLASRLRLWLLGLPTGMGLATLKATLKLCLGIPPRRSGVFSAGNGPAMRSAVLGAAIDDMALLRRFVRASTRLTHTDPKAEYGALAVAVAANMSSHGRLADGARYVSQLQELLANDDADELLGLLCQAVSSVASQQLTEDLADSLGLAKGVSGYVYHTVPVAIHACLRNPGDLCNAVMDVIRCGGDADTTAAIVGGIIGSGVGKEGIPGDWLDGLWEWPRTTQWMRRLAGQLSRTRLEGTTERPFRLPFLGTLARNVVFMVVVFAHAFRRFLPPY